MSELTLSDVAAAIADIDFAMLSTRAENGYLAARPMSNNGDVEYDGDNYFFAFEDSHTIKDIQRDPKIGLSFAGSKGLLSKPIFVAIEAHAELIRDKAAFKQHWNKDIEAWANQGVDTPGLVLIKTHAVRIHYWHGQDEQELVL
jgi:general stress protein 26